MRSKYLFSPVDLNESRNRKFFLLATKGSLSLFEIEKSAYLLWWLLFLPAFTGALFIATFIATLFGPFVGSLPALFFTLVLADLFFVSPKIWSWIGRIAFQFNQYLGAKGVPVHILETGFGDPFIYRLRVEAGGRERVLSLTSRRRTMNSALELAGSPAHWDS